MQNLFRHPSVCICVALPVLAAGGTGILTTGVVATQAMASHTWKQLTFHPSVSHHSTNPMTLLIR